VILAKIGDFLRNSRFSILELMKKYVLRKPPYPIYSVCEKIKKWFLPEKAGLGLHKTFISRTIFTTWFCPILKKVEISKNM